MDLRADMVTQAQDDVKANVDKASTEHNIQRLIDRKTKELQVYYIHVTPLEVELQVCYVLPAMLM